MREGIADILRTLRMPQLVLYMAWSDVRARYKRSVLGPLWITLGTAISIFAFGFIWSELLKMHRETFVPILTTGLILWQFMSACITEASSVFSRQASIIRNLDLPLSIHPAQLILRHCINLAHNIPLLIAVMLIMGVPFNINTLAVFPAFILVVANMFWMSMLIGVLGARFRDFEYMVSMIVPLLMFLSPVMFRPDALPFSGKYIWINPFADMIELMRYPLLGEAIPDFLLYINVGMLIVGGMITIMFFNAKFKRIAFWV
jgi:ABC-type polysaccharide/polyol phosphate export permease